MTQKCRICNSESYLFSNWKIGNRFLYLIRNAERMGCVTKEIIDDIIVLLHEMQNNALLQSNNPNNAEQLVY